MSATADSPRDGATTRRAVLALEFPGLDMGLRRRSDLWGFHRGRVRIVLRGRGRDVGGLAAARGEGDKRVEAAESPIPTPAE
jgi:hypothetical protein